MYRNAIVRCVLVGLLFAAQTQAGSAPSLNEPRADPAAVCAPSGDIWLVGGVSAGGQVLSSTEKLVYNRATGEYASEWITGPALPGARMDSGIAVSGRFIYLISGKSGLEFNPLGNLRCDMLANPATWVEMAPLQVPRCDAGVVTDRFGRVWVIGGITEGAATLATVEYYDPYQPQVGWQTGPALPAPRAYAGATADAHGNLLLFGGCIAGSATVYSDVFMLDPTNLASGWTQISDIPAPLSPNIVAGRGADGQVYLPGGWLPGFTDRVLQFRVRDGHWRNWAPLNLARNNHAVVLGYDEQLYVIGGNAYPNWPSSPTTSVERFSTSFLRGDIDCDGLVNAFDIDWFVECLINGGCPPCP
jgi:hypothetical protein